MDSVLVSPMVSMASGSASSTPRKKAPRMPRKVEKSTVTNAGNSPASSDTWTPKSSRVRKVPSSTDAPMQPRAKRPRKSAAAPGFLSWKPFIRQSTTAAVDIREVEMPLQPRVWSNTKADLKSVLPTITRSGVLQEANDMPTIILDEDCAADVVVDPTSSGRRLELTFTADFSCHKSDLRPPARPPPTYRKQMKKVQRGVYRLNISPAPCLASESAYHPHGEQNPAPCTTFQHGCSCSKMRWDPDCQALRCRSQVLPRDHSVPRTGINPNTRGKNIEPVIEEMVMQLYQGSDTSTNLIPVTKPPEVHSLVEAYLHARPVVAVVSHHQFNAHWGRRLSEEYGYVFLGCFDIINVKEDRIQRELPPQEMSAPDLVHGRMQWSFTLEWGEGGEDLLRERSQPDPWWSPAFDPLLQQPSTPELGQDHCESSAYYRHRRLRSSNCIEPLSTRCSSLLPADVLAEEDSMFREGSVQGWYCYRCGRLNPQVYFRRRTCPSRSCQDRRLNKGYWLDIDAVREPMQRQAVSMPADFTNGPPPEVGTWSDVRHVFTGNSSALQQDHTLFFKKFQEDVELARDISEDIPYFTYSAGMGAGACPWSNAPSCVRQARGMLAFTGEAYGHLNKTTAAVERLDAIAWMSTGAGSRKKMTLPARHGAVIVACLGHEVSLSIIQKSAPDTIPHPDILDGLVSMDIVDTKDPTFDSLTPQRPSSKAKSSPKKKSEACQFTLVHGDALILSGDDFEYSIKRLGTTILLIGLCARSIT